MHQDTSPISPAPTPERLPGEPVIMRATLPTRSATQYAHDKGGATWRKP